MREGCVELLLIDDDGVAFEERVLGGKTFVHGEAGKNYQVKVNVYRNEFGKYPVKHLLVCLLVDGLKISYRYKFDLSNDATIAPVSSKFIGFLTGKTYTSFAFTDPAGATTTSPQTVNPSQLGSIHVQFYLAFVLEDFVWFPTGISEGPAVVQSLHEEKKFWQQASLKTKLGTRTHAIVPQFTANWTHVGSEPYAELKFFYHSTAQMNFYQEHKDHIFGAPAGFPAVTPGTTAAVSTTSTSASTTIDLSIDEPPVSVSGPVQVVDLVTDASPPTVSSSTPTRHQPQRAVKRELEKRKKQTKQRKRVGASSQSVEGAESGVVLEMD